MPSQLRRLMSLWCTHSFHLTKTLRTSLLFFWVFLINKEKFPNKLRTVIMSLEDDDHYVVAVISDKYSIYRKQISMLGIGRKMNNV